MAASTTILDGLPARFLLTVKRGAPVVIEFTVVGVPTLASDDWVATLRGPGGVFVSSMSVDVDLVTVDTPNDSASVVVRLPAAVTAAMKPANYIFDVQDTSTDQVWADGKIKIVRNAVIA